MANEHEGTYETLSIELKRGMEIEVRDKRLKYEDQNVAKGIILSVIKHDEINKTFTT